MFLLKYKNMFLCFFHSKICFYNCGLVAVCSTVSNGVFALFGVTPATTRRSIESFASSFNMPYVSPSAPAPSWTSRRNASTAFTLYLRPTYHQAVIQLVSANRWSKIYYVYDDNDGTLLSSSRSVRVV